MTRSLRALRIAWAVLTLAYGGCLRAWVDAAWQRDETPGDGFLFGLATIAGPLLLGPWLARRLVAPTSVLDALSPADRATVERSLATGVAEGPITLRTTARDVARQRLADHPSPRMVAIIVATAVGVLAVLALLAHGRPLWLLAVTCTDLAGLAAIFWARRGRGARLDPDERERLRRLAKSV